MNTHLLSEPPHRPLRVYSDGAGTQSVAVMILQAQGKLPKPYDVFVFSNGGIFLICLGQSPSLDRKQDKIMTETEKRLAEIYSHYLDDRFVDDISETFSEWLATSMYADELALMCARLLTSATES